ncbi:MAG: hypothetical protein K940chlam9_00636 [Chlamydiae bacterium]|nr:hypothetical protein [Chlamydiota bacterium]
MKKVFLLFTLLFSLHCHAYLSDFSKGADGWEGDFTDFPVGEERFYELGWGWGDLPYTFEGHAKGLYSKGNNHSDDLFMFFKKKIEGFTPNSEYLCNYSLWIETNVPANSFGIGGSPGESVYFKIGGSPEEPKKVAKNGFYYLNVDKGNQAQGGENAKVIGDLANELVDPDYPTYEPKFLSGELLVKTDNRGDLWLFFGTDSGYEGFTKFYVASIEVELSAV